MYGETYPTRYQADKVRRTDLYHRSDEKIIKVCGGYKLMTPDYYYNIWKRQK